MLFVRKESCTSMCATDAEVHVRSSFDFDENEMLFVRKESCTSMGPIVEAQLDQSRLDHKPRCNESRGYRSRRIDFDYILVISKSDESMYHDAWDLRLHRPTA